MSAMYCTCSSCANFYLFLWPTALWKCPFYIFALPGPPKHMVQEDVTPLPYTKFCSRMSCLKLASILGLNTVCTVWNRFLKHSRAYSLETCKFISQLKILWFYHLEKEHLYICIAESVLCLLGLLCNCFINWIMILVFPKLWGTLQEYMFVLSWKLALCKKNS